MRRALALAATPLLLGGCAGMGELARSAVQPPKMTYRSAEVTALDFDGATLAFDFRLENRNPFGLTLAGVNYWLQLEERVVVRGKVPGGLKIPASGEAPVARTTSLGASSVAPASSPRASRSAAAACRPIRIVRACQRR